MNDPTVNNPATSAPLVFVKPYRQPERAAATRDHHTWLTRLNSGVRMPRLLTAGSEQLVFEHLAGRQPVPVDLPVVAVALGRLHAAAHARHLHAARLNAPFATADGLVITDFIGPRRAVLADLDLTLHGLPVAVYKDANIRNFLLTGRGVAIVDFDDLTLAPFGYDLAKLIVSTAMTYGSLERALIHTTLQAYNSSTQPIADTPTTLHQLLGYAEIHHRLTGAYLGRNGYRYAWPDVAPRESGGRW